MLRLLTIAALVAASAASAAPYFVHKHSVDSRREAAWTRTLCGSPGTGADIITSWGAQVTPNNVLPEYPRPQMTRDETASSYTNLNGLWEFQLANANDAIPFGQTLNQTILVPFPLESCLSGAFAWPTYSKYMFYRLLFDAPAGSSSMSTLLHFGAIDWNSTLYVNGAMVNNHVGGFEAITADITSNLKPTNNELIVAVYDPSDDGAQPNGKQRISAISNPGGDTYTPSSGIWQTVWLETVPTYSISNLRLRGDMQNLYITVSTSLNVSGTVSLAISFQGNPVTTFSNGATFTELVVPIPNPQLWSPGVGNLYDVNVTVTQTSTGATDTVGSYFGMREVALISYQTPPTPATGPRVGYDNAGGDMPGSPFQLNSSDYNLCWAICNQTAGCNGWSYGVPSCGGDGATPQCWLKATPGGWSTSNCRVAGNQEIPGGTAMRPGINGKFTFIAGWLDQSWWSDGEYTAPSDAALGFDLQAILDFGLNGVRLHQKVNSERWYYYADKLGIVVLQDMIQKYGGATQATVPLFLTELQEMIDGRYNHPSIIQWEIFNEGDCVGQFNATAVIDWALQYDPSRLIDTNSGGPANNLGIGNVYDVHSYPWPADPNPSATLYAMVGEFGGLGAFVAGHEFVPGKCDTYLPTPTPQDEADTYVKMAQDLLTYKPHVSVSIYTQITDVERECDGFYNMDRTNKFTAAQQAEIVAANQALINS